MSFNLNDSSSFNLNKNIILLNDREERTIQDENNNRLLKRQIDTVDRLRNTYGTISDNVGLYQSNMNGYLKNIDNESKLLNGKVGNVLTSHKMRKLKILPTRTFAGAPLKRSHIHKEYKTDTHTELLKGKYVHDPKSKSKLSGLSLDRSIPLIPKLRNNIQKVDHIVPKYVRGGENTRNNLRSIKYNVQ